MRIETVNVTPDQAEKWLQTAHGIPQRAITTRRVSTYASAMTRGQWRVTHQPIAIDRDGVLIDGQHRLSAVAMSRKTVTMSVAFDVPRESFDVIDTGNARSTNSILHIAGIPDANAAAAAARALLTYKEIDGTLRLPSADVRGQFTPRDVLDFMGTDAGAMLATNLRPAARIGAALAKYGTRSWIAAALTLIDLSEPGPSARNEFVEKWETGEMLASGNPILTLRRWMTSEHGYARSSGSYRGTVGIAGTVRAWNAYSTGNSLSLIRVRPGRERWPIVGRDDIDAADAESAVDELEMADA